jgi:hypothetical protein
VFCPAVHNSGFDDSAGNSTRSALTTALLLEIVYYWTKYVKKSVSIVHSGNKVGNWGAGPNGTVELQETLENPFQQFSKPRIRVHVQCRKFMCEFVHFSGKVKPWLATPPADISDATKNLNTVHLWFYELSKLNEELNMGLNFSNWKLKGARPPLGMYASYRQMDKQVAVHAKAEQRVQKNNATDLASS